MIAAAAERRCEARRGGRGGGAGVSASAQASDDGGTVAVRVVYPLSSPVGPPGVNTSVACACRSAGGRCAKCARKGCGRPTRRSPTRRGRWIWWRRASSRAGWGATAGRRRSTCPSSRTWWWSLRGAREVRGKLLYTGLAVTLLGSPAESSSSSSSSLLALLSSRTRPRPRRRCPGTLGTCPPTSRRNTRASRGSLSRWACRRH